MTSSTTDFLAIGRRVIRRESEALDLLADHLGDSFTAAVTTILGAQGRVIVCGMGKSGHIAKKIAATFASTGTPAQFVHPGEASHGDLGMVTTGDVALVLSNRFPLSVDLTANAAYEIGDETKQVLSALSQDITIDVLATEEAFSGDSYLVQAKRILEHYPQYSDRVSLRYIDYAADPSYAASHPDLTLFEGDVIVSGNGRVRQVSMTSKP